ncbi:nucleotidyltransferase family protein [Bacillus toyonensis]|uniref:nucleotidyltransferase family protein n=1 Tax=Bacillus toyonensis TaxID=155322 RepID=UPI000B433274|nr:nucleotidyltransferase family protein [Bacillus toyonensis]OTX04665.1 hypothetical protein BK712_18850 [Bacillus thuringiensis serovar seoulensis]MED3201925.1 nucleotidyltransferase family protein [Bacillus toyonensis]PEL51496.1 nucleotidyltransferase family protein [Bacillus toyonensis]PEP83739.1 nucleotidyltransferase family protein [Bacillus toyonensis]PGB58805.1 nucleotidyltransferase family protein [Bacillus toyonensis]
MRKSNKTSRFGALILAAGVSSRMGKPKQLLSINNETMIQHVIKQVVQAGFNQIILVLGFMDKAVEKSISIKLRKKIEIVRNDQYKKGISSSIKIGIGNFKGDIPVFIFLGDQPIISQKLILEMKTCYFKYQYDVIRNNYNNTPAHPVLLGPKLLKKVDELEGDKGFNTLINKNKISVKNIDNSNNLPIIDIDTKEDYFKFIKLKEGYECDQ